MVIHTDVMDVPYHLPIHWTKWSWGARLGVTNNTHAYIYICKKESTKTRRKKKNSRATNIYIFILTTSSAIYIKFSKLIKSRENICIIAIISSWAKV